MLGDESVGLVEDVLAEVEFLNGSEGKGVLGDVLHEGVLRRDSGVLGRDGTDLIALEDGCRKGSSIFKGVASGRHGSAEAPGAFGVSVTGVLVSEDIEARVSSSGGNGTEDGDSEH